MVAETVTPHPSSYPLIAHSCMFRSGKLPDTCSAVQPRRQPFLSSLSALVEFEIAEPGMVRKLAGSHHQCAQWNAGDLHTDHIADFFRRGNFRLLDKLALDLIDRHVCRHGQHKVADCSSSVSWISACQIPSRRCSGRLTALGDSTVCSARLTSGNSVLNVLVRS